MEKVHQARNCFTKTYTHRIKKEMLVRGKPNIEKLQTFIDRFCTFSTLVQQQYIDILNRKQIDDTEFI